MMGLRNLDGGSANLLGPEDLKRLASLGLTSACLAHDMGNLLQVIASALHLIDRKLKECGATEPRMLCENALLAVDRIVALRSQILDLARSEPARLMPVDLSAVVEGLQGLIQLTLGPHIVFDVVCGDDAPVVTCVAQELENAILNLVLNARDAMPAGGRLHVSLSREADNWADASAVAGGRPCAVLRVTDTGYGMSPDTLGRALQPFFTTKGSDRGTGLGLAMVAEFARRAGGTVEIESQPGEGTTVVLKLPVS